MNNITQEIQELNNTIWCRLGPSTIHGVGVIAIRNIPKGTKITNYNINTMYPAKRYSIPTNRMKEIKPPIRKLIMDRMMFVSSKTIFSFRSPNSEACLQSFMNHSDTPNTHLGVITTKNIKKGEEITENFNDLFYTQPHPLTKKHLKGIIK